MDTIIPLKPIEQSAIKMLELKRKQEQMRESLRALTKELVIAEENFVSDVHNHFDCIPDELILKLEYEIILVTFNTEDGIIANVSVPHQLKIDAEIVYTV